MSARARQYIEKQIVKKVAEELTSQGLLIEVNDGEEDVTEPTGSVTEIMAAVMGSDEDYFFVYKPDDLKENFGWIRFIYGNDGYDVINDHTTNLDPYMTQVNALVEELGG